MKREDLNAAITKWGSAFTMEMIHGTAGLYAPLALAPDEARVTRDIAYGPHERHKLDIFRPEGGETAPCLLFVHGGGFVMGDKGKVGEPFQNNIGAWAAREGFVGANITYRLAPEARWPDGRDDLIAAIKHLGENAAEYGIAPGKIVIMGESAGATHCADVVANPGEAAAHLGGAVMLSGIYDLRIAEVDQFKPQYYGEDKGGWPIASSKAGLAQTKLPCLFTVSQFDPPDFQKQARALVEAVVGETGHWPRIHWLKGHNHVSTTKQLGSPHDDLGPLLADFIKGL
jgi:triacylglycerol lipase